MVESIQSVSIGSEKHEEEVYSSNSLSVSDSFASIELDLVYALAINDHTTITCYIVINDILLVNETHIFQTTMECFDLFVDA